MALLDYGAIGWKNGKVLGKRDGLFEKPKNSLGFNIKPFDYTDNYCDDNRYQGGDDYIYVGDKDLIFSFYKHSMRICEYKEKKVNQYYFCYTEHPYKTHRIVFKDAIIIIKTLRLNRVWLATIYYKNDKYEVIFGYGIDPHWNNKRIQKEYDYTKKMIRFLESKDKQAKEGEKNENK